MTQNGETIIALDSINEHGDVAWMRAPGMFFDERYVSLVSEGSLDVTPFLPVSIEELLGIKGTALSIGDRFMAKVDIDATSPADAEPTVTKYLLPLTPEDIKELGL